MRQKVFDGGKEKTNWSVIIGHVKCWIPINNDGMALTIYTLKSLTTMESFVSLNQIACQPQFFFFGK